MASPDASALEINPIRNCGRPRRDKGPGSQNKAVGRKVAKEEGGDLRRWERRRDKKEDE